MNLTRSLLAIVGPTASGKTEVAFEIEKLIPAEIISCDSMQVYKGMSVITQAPKKKVHLASFLDPSKEYNAALFGNDAMNLISQITAKKKTPLIVGGTGLYLRALLDGLFEPEGGEASSDEALRKKFLSDQESHGGNYLHNKLEKIDPASAQKIHPNDLRRIVRALEVFYLTKKLMSEQKANRQGIRSDFNCRIFLLEIPRDELYARINRRVDRMLKDGLVEEVKKMKRKRLSMTAQMALGIREIIKVLGGECSLDEAVELLKRHTRNYAKRQISWFRHEKGVETVEVSESSTAVQTAKHIVQRLMQ